MVYLLALLLPMTLLYSPKIEKSGSVFFAKPMTITQERKSPAYEVFKQSQKIVQPIAPSSALELVENSRVVQLNANELATEKNILRATELVIQKNEVLSDTEKVLFQMANERTDSSLLSSINQNNFRPPQFSENQSKAATIRGNFELSEGVGIVDHIISLRRVFEGQSYELGEIDLRAGMYQILVGSFEGELVAEIKDRNGIIIGDDRQKILGLKRNGLFFSGPLIKVGQPSAIGFNLRNVDDRKLSENDTTASLYSRNYSLKKTTDTYPNVASLSSTVGYIKDRTNKNAMTLSLRTAKDHSDTVLFTQKWVDGLKKYLSDKLQIQYLPSSGLIIGRVIQDGKPVQGVQVVIENQPGLEPYYLDQFLIPQTEQATTSTNGYFVIPGLNHGKYQISAFLKDRHIGNQLYFVEENIVTYQEILSTRKTQSVIVRAFDSFTGSEMQADLVLPGFEDIFSVSEALARYRTSTAEGLQEIKVRPLNRDYMEYTYLQNSKKDHLHLPLVPDAYVDQLRLQKQIPQSAGASVFVGFAPAGKYDLHLTAENFDRKQIIFFDSSGMPVEAPVTGGGFVIYNLPEGLQEIVLQDQKTDRTYSQVIFIEPAKNYVAHFVE